MSLELMQHSKVWCWCGVVLTGENKILNISKWKSEIGALRNEKDSLYSQIIDIWKEVEQAESVSNSIEKLLQENMELT